MNVSQRLSKEILNWRNVTSGTHRFGGLEFRVGTREMGHIHGDILADLPFPMNIRDNLVNSGRVLPSHTSSIWMDNQMD